ncbi:MAG TPA: DUF4156 domain-containing protein [Polyangiaceae bacterium]|nr:DUF4156 domain-containing protein [Polyangiaceae bacterium]
MPNKALLLGLVVVCQACIFDSVVKLDPEASKVEIVRDTSRPLDCDYKGKISGSSRSDDEKKARTGAENDFRNHAAELKANFALIENERTGHVGTTSKKEAFIGGKALYCRTLEMQQAEEARQEKAAQEKEEREIKEQAEKERKAEEEKEKREREKEEAKEKEKEKGKDK